MNLLAGIGQAAQGADPDSATPGMFGFLMLVVLGLAVYGLFRSMKKQLGRVEVPYADDPEGLGEDAVDDGRTA